MAKAMKKAQSGGTVKPKAMKPKAAAPKKAQLGRAIKKLCRPGDTGPGCPQTKGMSGYGGGGYNKGIFKRMFRKNK